MRSFKIHRCLNFIRSRFTTSKNKLGQDSPFPKFLHLKIRRQNGVESLTTLEEGEFKFAIDGCINGSLFHTRNPLASFPFSTKISLIMGPFFHNFQHFGVFAILTFENCENGPIFHEKS